ncbi:MULTISPECIES: type II secretion system protein [unclassified Pseudomonas]|uniref:type II secretion system protein n=1 Tax=unclassified Pseudomonas TaxID=196821 RepID=UPI000837F416|nr:MULTISPECIES: type II secretion system protein [unclassified Pseudomonas]QIH08091.1 type II secretion system protein [Pseudomonas sp. BIOMIG1BAC]
MTPLPPRQQRGFTLVELLAAIVVLSIGFAVVLNTLGYATQALARDGQTTRMALMATSLMAEYGEGLGSGAHLEGTRDGVQWRLSATPLRGEGAIVLDQLELMLVKGSRQERFVTLKAIKRPAGGLP